jgi:hypothetical protein
LPKERQAPAGEFIEMCANPVIDREPELPNDCHRPPAMAIPEVRAEPSVDRKPEFPDDCHPPMALREPRAAACEGPE